MAHIIDGVFDVSDEGVLSLLSGPTISRTLLESFADLVADAAKRQSTVEELQQTAEKLDPALGELVRRVRARDVGLAALVILFIFLRSCNFDVQATVDINRLFDQWTAHGSRTILSPPPPAGSDIKNAQAERRSEEPEPR